MTRIKVTIKTTETATFDIGKVPAGLIRDLLTKNDGTFDGNWSLGDIPSGNQEYTTDSVEVEELTK